GREVDGGEVGGEAAPVVAAGHQVRGAVAVDVKAGVEVGGEAAQAEVHEHVRGGVEGVDAVRSAAVEAAREGEIVARAAGGPGVREGQRGNRRGVREALTAGREDRGRRTLGRRAGVAVFRGHGRGRAGAEH